MKRPALYLACLLLAAPATASPYLMPDGEADLSGAESLLSPLPAGGLYDSYNEDHTLLAFDGRGPVRTIRQIYRDADRGITVTGGSRTYQVWSPERRGSPVLARPLRARRAVQVGVDTEQNDHFAAAVDTGGTLTAATWGRTGIRLVRMSPAGAVSRPLELPGTGPVGGYLAMAPRSGSTHWLVIVGKDGSVRVLQLGPRGAERTLTLVAAGAQTLPPEVFADGAGGVFVSVLTAGADHTFHVDQGGNVNGAPGPEPPGKGNLTMLPAQSGGGGRGLFVFGRKDIGQHVVVLGPDAQKQLDVTIPANLRLKHAFFDRDGSIHALVKQGRDLQIGPVTPEGLGALTPVTNTPKESEAHPNFVQDARGRDFVTYDNGAPHCPSRLVVSAQELTGGRPGRAFPLARCKNEQRKKRQR